MTSAAAMLEAFAALCALLATFVAGSAGLRLPAGDERRQAVDVAVIGLHLRLWLLLLRTILAELRLARVGLLARRIGLLLRLRREAGLGAECGELSLVLFARIVTDIAVGAGLLLILLRLVLPELLLRGGNDPEIMLGVLIVVLCGDRIAGSLRVTCELYVLLGQM